MYYMQVNPTPKLLQAILQKQMHWGSYTTISLQLWEHMYLSIKLIKSLHD